MRDLVLNNGAITVKFNDGCVEIYKAGRVIRTDYLPDGSVRVSPAVELEQALNKMPVLAFVWNGEDYLVDVSAGMQQWNGCKTGRELSAGLTRLGILDQLKRDLMAYARKNKRDYAPRFW